MDGTLPDSAGAPRPAEHVRDAGRGLSPSSTFALRRIAHAYREGWILDSRFEAVAGMIADDARSNGFSAEQMLVVLKRSWNRLDDVKDLPDSERRELLDRIVTLYIEAYYAAKTRVVAERVNDQTDGQRSD